MKVDLAELSVQQLLELSRRTLNELRTRQIVRTSNSPVGDWAELLVATAVGGSLAPNSEKSYDVLCADGSRIQVKARMLDPERVGSNTLSAIRSWDFEDLVIVLFDPNTFKVLAAAKVPADQVEAASRFSEHTNSWTVRPTKELMASGDNLTTLLRKTAEAI